MAGVCVCLASQLLGLYYIVGSNIILLVWEGKDAGLTKDCGGLNKNGPYRPIYLMFSHRKWNCLKGLERLGGVTLLEWVWFC